MKKRLFAGVSTLAIVLMTATGASAACNTDLREVDKKIDQKQRSSFVSSAQDIRRLRDAAAILAEYDKENACQTVVKAISDIVDKNQQRRNQASADNRDGDKKQMTEADKKKMSEADRKKMAENEKGDEARKDRDRRRTGLVTYNREEMAGKAQPLWSDKAQFSAERMDGATVYSTRTNESIGEIEDILIGSSEKNSFVVIGYGGFLGIGEKKIMIPISAVKVNPEDNSYYVPLTEEQLKGAPKVEYKDNKWVGDPIQVSENEAAGQKDQPQRKPDDKEPMKKEKN